MTEARGGGSGDGERLLVVAVVRKPHGVRGELHLAVETDRPNAVFRKGRVLRLGDSAGRPDGRTVTIEQARPMKDGLLVRIAEHESREAVEALRGVTMLIAADEAAPADPDEVPYHRLIGCAVIADGETVGRVTEVLEVGGGEMLAVRRPRGKELLVPFAKELIRRLDLDRREVEIDAPEGLLDL